MGFYIETPLPIGKADYLIDALGAEKTGKPDTLAGVPDGKGLVAVVSNGIFEAAAYVFDDRELEAFSDPSDLRPKTWLVMDKDAAERASGYRR